MSSETVSKIVAKKLKYYLDVKRREDAFDLTSSYLPQEDPTPLRAGPTLAYDGIHDRSLKHYFRNNSIKTQLQHMTIPKNMHQSREKSIRRYVDDTMASVDYRLKPGPISPYAYPQAFRPSPPPHRPYAMRTVDEYFRTRRGSRRRKTPVNVVGKARRIARRSPPQHIHKDERERLVNMASKLIVATETVALPKQKKQSKGFQASDKEFPMLERRTRSIDSSAESAIASGHESETSLNGRTPKPPKYNRASQRRPQSSFFKSSSFDSPRNGKTSSGVHVILPGESSSDNDKLRYLMDRMNLDGRGTSVMASPRESDKKRPKSAAYPLKSTANTAVETGLPNYSDDDDFSSEDEPPREPARTPRMSWMTNTDNMVDMCTQTVVHSGTQTKFPELEESSNEISVSLPSTLSWADNTHGDDVDSRSSVAIATAAAPTADALTSTSAAATSHETQTRNRDLEPKVITYEVYVQTGDRLGAGSKVNVKITLFGEYGNTGERQLLRSKTHRNKFQRGQVDVFVIDSLFLGKLQSIRIGHSETRLGYGWFLDHVLIKEGASATRAFQFRCNRWFSSRDDDGQIMRDLPLCDVVPASHADMLLPKETERRDEFYSQSDSETSRSESEATASDTEPRATEKTSRKKVKQKAPNKAKKPAREVSDEIDGFTVTNMDNLFDVSDDEEQNVDRFFEPEEENESERSEDERVIDRKPIKNFQPDTRKTQKFRPTIKKVMLKQKPKHVVKEPVKRVEKKEVQEQENEVKEEEDEEEDEEEEVEVEKEEETTEESPKEDEETQPKRVLKGSGYLRVITTALSPFLSKTAASQPSPILEEPTEVSEQETKETSTQLADSEDDEPAVEFTQKSEKKQAPERPSSAKSDDFEQGLRAGIRKKHEEERKRHRESINESVNVLTSGSSIHDAAKAGNLPRIKELIQAVPAMKSTQDERGMTALHLAASNGHLDCVKWLAVSGVDLADETPTGYTAMHLAAMNGHVNCMMILAAMGSAVGCKTVDAFTPLHLASMSGHIECVKWLLANRAALDVDDSNGRTPLDIAEEYGHEAIIKLFKKFKKELTRQDSTLAQLMKHEKRRKSNDSNTSDVAPSKVSDSGVGGMESEEDNWISDTEEDATGDVAKNEAVEQSSGRRASTTSRERPDSASRSRTDSIVSAEEKKKLFEQQRRKMKKRHSSFLDSIRMDVDNNDDDF